ncbi:MAG TPA: PUA domain-containing protein [Nitrososphaera sp.]
MSLQLCIEFALKSFLLSKTETARILNNIGSSWPQFIPPKIKSIKVYEIESDKLLLFANELVAVKVRGTIVPFLGKPQEFQYFPSVTIDLGAIKFVCNGAKVLRPGIVNFDSFENGDIVAVKEQSKGRTLAVGIALVRSEEAKAMSKGYIIDNLHYVSDKIWVAYKNI